MYQNFFFYFSIGIAFDGNFFHVAHRLVVGNEWVPSQILWPCSNFIFGNMCGFDLARSMVPGGFNSGIL